MFICTLTAIFILSSGANGHGFEFENLAAMGKAIMPQSWDENSGAEKAIDGDYSNLWVYSAVNSIMHTKDRDSWWRLDFAREVYIHELVLWARVDVCCQYRMGGIRVHIDDKLMGTVGDADISVLKYPVDINRVGESVKLLSRPGDWMNIAEVEVFGTSANKKFVNIARAIGRATISGVYRSNYGADKAVDGNHETLMITSLNGNGWWKVDFPRDVFIDAIVIWNTPNRDYQYRISGVKVYVDDEVVGTLQFTGDLYQQTYACDNIGRIGRAVTVTAAPRQHMNLAEIEVYGDTEL